jgi:probable F420-dependent oxidoreductase
VNERGEHVEAPLQKCLQHLSGEGRGRPHAALVGRQSIALRGRGHLVGIGFENRPLEREIQLSDRRGGPPGPLFDVERQHREPGRILSVLAVLGRQERKRALGLLSPLEHPAPAPEAYPPEAAPVGLVAVDEDGDMRTLPHVLDASQASRTLRLGVDRAVERLALEHEDDGDKVRPVVRVQRREARNLRLGNPLPQYARVVHLGVILPNFGERSSPSAIRRTTEAAEELGFDSVWTTEHIIVGPEGVDPYGRVYDPLVTLGWIAGFSERIGLGTSIVLAPLHHPIHLAKEAATLQEISGGRLRLGLGMGWHEDEFRFMGVEFRGRGRRANEAIRVMQALWRGETSFEGEHWAFENATFAPLPELQPEIWIGGSSPPAIRRVLELGDVWHPSRRSDPDHVRRVKQEHPELRVVPRTSPDRAEGFLEAGAEGVVVTLSDEAAMEQFVRRYR